MAFSALWVRSVTHFEQISVWHVSSPGSDETTTRYVGFSWYSNTLRLEVVHQTFLPTFFRDKSVREVDEFRRSRTPGWRWSFAGEHITRAMNGYPAGFAIQRWPYKNSPAAPGVRWVLAVRSWLPPLLTAVLPAIWLYRFRKAHCAQRQGLCPGCGYDLRATPDRCPECGLEQPVKTAAAVSVVAADEVHPRS